jgi:hypothetical protein
VRSIHALGPGHAKTISLWRPYRKWAGKERIPLELRMRRRRGCRSSASFAIHDISGIPGSPIDRVGKFGSWRDPGGAQAFPAPYLMRYIERARTRVVSGFARDSGSGIVDRLRFGSRLLMDEPGCPPGISLLSGMPNMAVPILIITGPVAVSVRLLPFHRTGCLRYLRDLRDPWWLWGLWWLWRYSTYLVAGFTRCSAAD